MTGGAVTGGAITVGVFTANEVAATVGWGLLCVAVPVLWGVAVNAIFERLARRKGAGRDAAPPEYQI